MFLSVKIVLVKSIERIHAANLVNFGILPLVFKFPEDFKNIDEKDCMEIVNIKDTLENNLNFEVFNKTKKINIQAVYDLSDRQKKVLLAGGLLNYIRRQ